MRECLFLLAPLVGVFADRHNLLVADISIYSTISPCLNMHKFPACSRTLSSGPSETNCRRMLHLASCPAAPGCSPLPAVWNVLGRGSAPVIEMLSLKELA